MKMRKQQENRGSRGTMELGELGICLNEEMRETRSPRSVTTRMKKLQQQDTGEIQEL